MSRWPLVPLGDVALIERSTVNPSQIRDGTLYVGLEHIESGGQFTDIRPVHAGDLASTKFAFSAKHVLYGKLRPYLAKIARPSFSGICSTDILPILPGAKLDRGYLALFLLKPDVVALATSRATGANLPRLSPKALEQLKVPLPPLPEQRRIAAILDKADKLRAKRRAALEMLETLTNSVFFTTFDECERPPISIGDPTFGTTSSFVPLREVARLATGHTPDRKKAEYWNGTIPWISLTDIRQLDGSIVTRTLQSVTELGIANSSAVLLPPGTVCFSRTATVGFVAVMGAEMATSQDFVNWVCGDRLDPTYLMFALRLSRPYLLSKSSGTTHKTIYYRQAEQFQVFLPPRELQQHFSTIIKTVEQQKARQRAAMDDSQALFASLQQRAFRGEL